MLSKYCQLVIEVDDTGFVKYITVDRVTITEVNIWICMLVLTQYVNTYA